MLRNTIILIAAVALAATADPARAITRGQLATYAASLQGKSGASLKEALHEMLAPRQTLDYGSGDHNTWWGFWYTDRDTATNECINRYSDKKFYFESHNGRSISGMNIEHSFPKSWWGGTKNDAYRDLYNLYPSDKEANSAKSNYPMGVVTTVRVDESPYDKVGTGNIDGQTQTCWEPGDAYKGDFARAYLYMAVAYADLTFVRTGLLTMENSAYPGMKPWATTLYRQWSRNDTVDGMEATRNDAVAALQECRNLFVDFPYLCEYVWGDSTSIAFDPATALTTATDDRRYLDAEHGIEPPAPDADSYEYYRLTASAPADGGRYLIVAATGSTLQAAKPVRPARGKSFGYLYTAQVSESDGVVSLSTDTLAFTFEATEGGFLISDHDGRYYGQEGSYSSFTPSLQASGADVWTVEARPDGTYAIKASDSNHTILYSTSYHSYGNYASEPTGSLYPRLYELRSTATGISLRPQPATSRGGDATAVYNLQGQRVGTRPLPAGIYIRNGRKFVVR